MPAVETRHAPRYAEKLRVPTSWWFIATAGVAVGGAEVFAGFEWRVAGIVYAVLGLPTLALLIGMGRGSVRVDTAGLHAGGRTLPRDEITAARALDARETRHLLGAGRNPAAYVVVRGFVKTAVLIRPADDAETPYWLVSTRRPADLVAALRPPATG